MRFVMLFLVMTACAVDDGKITLSDAYRQVAQAACSNEETCQPQSFDQMYSSEAGCINVVSTGYLGTADPMTPVKADLVSSCLVGATMTCDLWNQFGWRQMEHKAACVTDAVGR